jgi:hypothetical protein
MTTIDETDSEEKQVVDGDGTHKESGYDVALARPSSHHH